MRIIIDTRREDGARGAPSFLESWIRTIEKQSKNRSKTLDIFEI